MIASISVILTLGAVVIPVLALWQRIKANKGIGWSFIRFTVIASTIPIAAVLALNGVLGGEAGALLGTAIGYAFGHSSDKPSPSGQDSDA